MASISVRKLDNHVYSLLQVRAKMHGVSMEEEARRIIAQVVSAPEKISDVFRKYFGPEHGVDLKQLNQPLSHDPMDFES